MEGKNLIIPDEIQQWIPGKLTLDSQTHNWDGLTFKGYYYSDQDVHIPAMRDYMIVNYKQHAAEMRCKHDSPVWQSKIVKPGHISLLTYGEDSRWSWDNQISVSHIYLPHKDVNLISTQIFNQEISAFKIKPQVSIEDPILDSYFNLLEHELKIGGIGGDLFIESIKNQIAIHLLRHFADLDFSEKMCSSGLNKTQKELLFDYIQHHIALKITLADLARILNMSVPHLMRKFKIEFGQSPANYIMDLRVKYAKKLLQSKPDLPLKAIALDSGFCDQSHMSRVFQKTLNKTPLEIRRR